MRTPLPDDIPLLCRGDEIDRILAELRGNALYVRELVISALDSGALTQEGGIWSLRRPLAAPGPLVELVASRLAGLAPEARAAIDVLAVGEPIGLSVLDKITDPGGLEEAEARGFVSVHQDGWRTEARLAHPLYGEAVRQVLPLSRRRRIAASLALAVEATSARRRDDLLRLGRWQLDAGTHGDPVLRSSARTRPRLRSQAGPSTHSVPAWSPPRPIPRRPRPTAQPDWLARPALPPGERPNSPPPAATSPPRPSPAVTVPSS